MVKPVVLALDLEGTLISNAMSQIPRPGLYEFLQACLCLFPRIVIFTAVREEKFRQIANLLVADGVAPAWFAQIEYVNWQGRYKDLNFVNDTKLEQVLLIDDYEHYFHPEQTLSCLQIAEFCYPYPDNDNALYELQLQLRASLR